MSDADAALVERVLAGDRAAFEGLVLRHTERARAVARSVLSGEPHAVDDAVQEAFIRAYQRLGQLSDARTFPSWLAAIVRNEAISHLRRTGRARHLPIEVAQVQANLQHHSGEGAAPESDAAADAHSAQLQALGNALSKLREPYREILALKYEAKLSYEEIAETLGTNVTNVEKRLYRARQALIGLMGENGKLLDQ